MFFKNGSRPYIQLIRNSDQETVHLQFDILFYSIILPTFLVGGTWAHWEISVSTIRLSVCHFEP